ncbi:MAG: hypothetical protein AABW89_00540 [Nanoarchaeota archaeon]
MVFYYNTLVKMKIKYNKKTKNKKIKSYFGIFKGIGPFVREKDRAIGQLD